MYRTIIILSWVIFCGSSTTAYSDTVYKWRDKDGVLHFTDSPGPEQSRPESTNAKKPKITRRNLLGNWFSKERHRKLTLRLGRSDVSMQISPAYGSRLANFRANWRLGGGAIKLTYTDHGRERGKIGQNDNLYITGYDGETLTLLLPDGGKYLFYRELHRLKSKGNPSTKNKLYGIWNIKNSPHFLRIDEGRFTVTTDDRYEIIRQGHWDLTDNTIVMTYYNKSRFSQHEMAGKKEKLKILLLDPDNLVIERASNNKREHYCRSILE